MLGNSNKGNQIRKSSRKATATWKSIDQSSQARAVSGVARKRQIVKFCKHAGIACGSTVALGLVCWCVHWFQVNPHGMWMMGTSAPLREIYFETDGVLTEAWLEEQIDIPDDATLMDINIYELQQSLQLQGQTKAVIVERIFPHALKIKVFEHIPVMRLVIMDAVGKKHIMMVGEQGNVYAGVNYQQDMLVRLPYLIGVELRRRNNGFEKIRGVDHVSHLLQLARTQYPSLYADWKYLSMEHFDGNPGELGASLQVHTHSAGIIAFNPVGFAKQLQELDSILLYAKNNRRWQSGTIEGIDLTLSEPVLRMANIVGAN